jgi:outer membrane receptor protein involved in Fe transport
MLLVAPRAAPAQVLYGTIVGAVEDPSGAVVPNARLTLTNVATGVSRESTADAEGRINLINVPAGTYTLAVSAPGFRTVNRTDILVTINTVTRVTVTLEVGQVSEQVTVTGTAAVLQTDRSDTRAEIHSRAVVELPLPNYRNYQSLINLVPGATPAAFQNAVVDTPARSLTTNINGTNRNNNNTRLDGALNVFIWLPHHTLYNPPVESIETVNISTSSFDAEQGMAGGAAVTVATKSGTNDVRGAAFWYHDRDGWFARPFFHALYAGVARPELPHTRNNIMGGAIGGPIKKNKFFYFMSYERTHERTGHFGNFSVPNPDMRAGNFAAYSALGLIHDPLTGDPNGRGRIPFAGNIIPAARHFPGWRSMLELAPMPNQMGTDAFNLENNFGAHAVQSLTRDQVDVKFNYQVNEKLMLFWKNSFMNAPVHGFGALGALTGPGLGTLGTGDTKVYMPSVGFNLTLSPTLLVDGVFGYAHFDQNVIGPDFGRNWGTEVWGIPGTNGGRRFGGDLRYSGQPCIATGQTSWGNCAGWMPLFRNDRSFTYTTNFTKVKGAHEIRWGADVVHHGLNHWQPEVSGGPRGNIAPAGMAMVHHGQVARPIHTHAAGLHGVIGSAMSAVQFLEMRAREWQTALYVRDRWQVTRNLTLNLGLRYEYYPLMNRGDRGLERWDPATNIVTLGGIGDVPFNNGITVSNKLFAPRVGFAWRLNDKTVVRSGYGITYNPLPVARPLRGLYPASIGSTFVAPEPWGQFGPFGAGIPDVVVPDISTGRMLLPPTVDMGPRSPWGGHLRRGYIQSWNFTLERQLPMDFLLSVGYVGNQTVGQFLQRDINAAPVGTGPRGRPLAATQNRLIPALMWDGWGSANYHSLQVAVNKNLSRGLFMKGAYTWSKAINLGDDDGTQGMAVNLEPAMHRNRAVAGYDRTHMFVMSWVYEMPFGRGQRYALRGFADALLGGWRVNGIYSAYTGTPFTVTAAAASLIAPGSAQWADQVAPWVRTGEVGLGSRFYEVGAFRDPIIGMPPGGFRFGTMGRNAMRGPGFHGADLAMFKDFRLTERFVAQFKAEAFNFTNTPRFGNPDGGVSQMAVDAAGNVLNPVNFMSVLSAFGERRLRFGVRVSF